MSALNYGDEKRMDTELCHRQDPSYEEREPSNFDQRRSGGEEREAAPYDRDSFEDELECHRMLLQTDQEEKQMQRELQLTLQQKEKERALAVLDELLRIHEEEYPEPMAIDYVGTITQEDEVDSEHPIDIEVDDDADDLDSILLREGTPLSNDTQIEELVARCDLRDKDIENGKIPSAFECSDTTTLTAPTGGHQPNQATCVVCLVAPRTHAYVPCGHFCVCFSCAKEQAKQRSNATSHSSCPVCKQLSSRVMRIFIP